MLWFGIGTITLVYGAWDLLQGEECPECEVTKLAFLIHRNPGRGESWAYFKCKACGARVRQRPDGPFEGVEPEVWDREVGL